MERLRKVGGKGIVELRLTPAKRGKFVMMWVQWQVVQPGTADLLKKDEPLPDRPWLSCDVAYVYGNGEMNQYVAFVLTHHALQRLAERCGVRTPDDMLAALKDIWGSMRKKIAEVKLEAEDKATLKAKANEIKIWKLPFSNGVAIVEKTRDIGFVVKTVLDDEMT